MGKDNTHLEEKGEGCMTQAQDDFMRELFDFIRARDPNLCELGLVIISVPIQHNDWHSHHVSNVSDSSTKYILSRLLTEMLGEEAYAEKTAHGILVQLQRHINGDSIQ